GLLAIGGLAFLAFAAVGSRREINRLFGALRVAGLVVLVGGLVGIVARAWLIDGGGPDAIASTTSLRDSVEGDAGLALVLTALGGLLVALGARAAYGPAPGVAIAAGSWDEYRPQRVVGGSIRNAWIAVSGVVVIAIGAALDGHTASEGPRVVVWAADLVHIAAAGVWLGGLALLVALLVGRRRAGRPANGAYPAVRFATLAGAGSAGAALAGIALAIIVLPSVSALWESAWGLLLVAKVALVAIVATMGAHNHFRLIPGLADHLAAAEAETRDDPVERRLDPGSAGSVATLVREERVAGASGDADEAIAAKLRRNATVELLLLGAVVAITAALVGTSAV
ncbi:MAG: CopD family protein, partial [Miltoncostaeaceae bacterium]